MPQTQASTSRNDSMNRKERHYDGGVIYDCSLHFSLHRLASYLTSFKLVSQIDRECVSEGRCQSASVFSGFFFSVCVVVKCKCVFSFLLHCIHSVVRHQRSCRYTLSAQCPEFSGASLTPIHTDTQQTHTHTLILFCFSVQCNCDFLAEKTSEVDD